MGPAPSSNHVKGFTLPRSIYNPSGPPVHIHMLVKWCLSNAKHAISPRCKKTCLCTHVSRKWISKRFWLRGTKASDIEPWRIGLRYVGLPNAQVLGEMSGSRVESICLSAHENQSCKFAIIIGASKPGPGLDSPEVT